MSSQPTRVLSWRDWFTDLPAESLLAAAKTGRSSLHSIIPMIRPIVRRLGTPQTEAARMVSIAHERWGFASTRIVTGENGEQVKIQRPDLPLCILYQNVGWGVLDPAGGPQHDYEIALLEQLAQQTVRLIEKHEADGGTVAAILLDAEGYGTNRERRDFRDLMLERHFWSIIGEAYPGLLMGNYGSRQTQNAPTQPVLYGDMIDAATAIARLADGETGNPWIPMPGFVRRHGRGLVTAGDFAGYLWAASHAGGTVLLWGDGRSRRWWPQIDAALQLASNQWGNFPWRDREGYTGHLTIDGVPVEQSDGPPEGWF